MDKLLLCKKIGESFGDFYERDGKLIIDNGEEEFVYDTPDALLIDWVDTLIEQHVAGKKYFVSVVKKAVIEAPNCESEEEAKAYAKELLDTPSDLSINWTDVTVGKCLQKSECNWGPEINFIFNEIIKDTPRYVYKIKRKHSIAYKAEVYRNNGKPHGEMVHLGNFDYIADAIIAIRNYERNKK